MSITLASQDLCLTQSAVSRQVNALEDHLGVKLLVRGYRSIQFTSEGERLFRSADGVMQHLQDIFGDIRAAEILKPVTLSASIGVTGLWLLPRLNRFQQLHPGVAIHVSADNRISDLRNEGIDLAIRYTTEELAPPGSRRLFSESIAPVAHPSVGQQLQQASGSLTNWSLLEFDDPHHSWLQWRDWLTATDWPDHKPQGMLRFNQYDQVIQAALAGQGIALGRLELIQPLLDNGQLVTVAQPRTRGAEGHAYWLIRAQDRPRADVDHVAAWIAAEAGVDSRPGAT